MKKQTTGIIAIVALIIGVGIGYIADGYRSGPGHYGQMKHTMRGDEMKMDMRRGHTMNMGMEEMMTSMNANLEGKTGDAFDRVFLDEMIVHHQGAVSMANLALTNAGHQEIKDLAAGIIAAQNKEIAEMKAWQQAWFK